MSTNSIGFKAELHKAKARIAREQAKITQRHLLLLTKLMPLIKHPDDKKLIETVLSAKNITPRYW